MDDILSVNGLTVSFDGFKALDSLDFSVRQDELRVVIGPNGAGKTTLLDLICGKTKPDSGSINFKGQDVTGMIEYQITRAGIGRKFQTPSIYQDLTVYENLEISYPEKRSVFGSLFFKSSAELVEKINGVAELVDSPDQVHQLAKGVMARNNPEIPAEALDEVAKAMSVKRTAVVVKATKVVSWDHQKLGGTY